MPATAKKKSARVPATAQKRGAPIPATAEKKTAAPVVYSDQEHNNQPICLDCFLRIRNETTDCGELEKWGRAQAYTRAIWERIPTEIRQQKGLEDPHGWVKLFLDTLKWPRTKGRCWACCHRLALNYLMLTEEVNGAQPSQAYCILCQRAAAETNTLALEVAASGYKPNVPILQPDLKYGHLVKLSQAHLASLGTLLAEPENPMVHTFWHICHSRILKALGVETVDGSPSEKFKYEPLQLGAQKLWEIAVILKQTANMGAIAKRNFSGVVESNAKESNNPPKRLALVQVYEWSQKMVPRMTYIELASLLIEHGVADECGGEVVKLADNIKVAVSKYRKLLPLGSGRY